MALTAHGFIVLPKTNIVQIPSCESYRHRPLNMLQITHHDHMHANRRNISRSIICGAKSTPEISKGDGGKINGTKTSREQNVSDENSSSKTDQNDGKQSNGDAKATTRKPGSTG
ncbi:hypothetical protein D8674_038861 [Pyrus ussuriensis x Pyrus communis]|uniref:Uncharacterized protein n=1 Tax=Pyrus ussuriensis x Pyrus communis TaxID=2448454 RepID=A0A5N5H6I4_9ROSA|nr:hypothetical protein D8674_038861 [Pyrus ussuriensis x Pyrus communis]